MTQKEATRVAEVYLQSIIFRAAGDSDAPKSPPVMYRIQMSNSSFQELRTVAGPLDRLFMEEVFQSESDPVEFAFFIDLIPNANWEHPCEYLFVHESGKISITRSKAPPSQKYGAVKIRLNIPN